MPFTCALESLRGSLFAGLSMVIDSLVPLTYPQASNPTLMHPPLYRASAHVAAQASRLCLSLCSHASLLTGTGLNPASQDRSRASHTSHMPLLLSLELGRMREAEETLTCPGRTQVRLLLVLHTLTLHATVKRHTQV